MMYYECVSADWLDSFLGTKVWDAEFSWHVGPSFFSKAPPLANRQWFLFRHIITC